MRLEGIAESLSKVFVCQIFLNFFLSLTLAKVIVQEVNNLQDENMVQIKAYNPENQLLLVRFPKW